MNNIYIKQIAMSSRKIFPIFDELQLDAQKYVGELPDNFAYKLSELNNEYYEIIFYIIIHYYLNMITLDKTYEYKVEEIKNNVNSIKQIKFIPFNGTIKRKSDKDVINNYECIQFKLENFPTLLKKILHSYLINYTN